MPEISEGWEDLIKLIQSCSDTELNLLLTFLLTPEEKEQILKRLSLVRALMEQQLTQRQIAEKLQVSIAKITRGSNAIKSLSKEKQTLLNTLFERDHPPH